MSYSGFPFTGANTTDVRPADATPVAGGTTWAKDKQAGVTNGTEIGATEWNRFKANWENMVTGLGGSLGDSDNQWLNAIIAYVAAEIAGITNAYLARTGGTLTGDLIINRDGADTAFRLQSDAGRGASIQFRTDTTLRWQLYKTNAAESGSNAGSNLQLYAYDDAGSLIATVLSIVRATGVVTFSSPPVVGTASPGTNTTAAASTAFVQAAIAALVNSAPGVLDTLDELAAALGDDANFAATMTTALALKAPLASPTFTGTPAAPTAAGGTNTTQLATTAFVAAAIAALTFSAAYTSSDQTITAAGALTLAHSLGVAPTLVQLRLKCITAEYNYSVGDLVEIGTGNGVTDRAISVVADATNINIRFGSSLPSVPNKTTGAGSTITAANWKLVARAWK